MPNWNSSVDSAYASQQELIRSKAPLAKDRTNQRVVGSGVVADLERMVNRIKSKVRSRVEQVFAVVKRQFGFAKLRYRSLEKNATRAFVALGLANIYLACAPGGMSASAAGAQSAREPKRGLKSSRLGQFGRREFAL